MLQDLTEKFDRILRKVRGQGKLTPENIEETMREIRKALLEADVNFRIVKTFISNVKERALGVEVLKSLTPAQQLVKIVNQELIKLMGEDGLKVNIYDNKMTKMMLVGLQGSGKTTASAKLANYFRKQNAKPMLVACDVHRPAAVEQLLTLGRQLDLTVYSEETKKVDLIAENAIKLAAKELFNLVIFDTAGRLHIDQQMMEEVSRLKITVKPDYVFFVADAMTGQDAVNVARDFDKTLDFDGVILTKMDGDARGGAALSIKYITGKPVVYIGTGEKPNNLEEFHAERMASRILGMGDVLSLIERAESAIDSEKAEKLAKKLKKNLFTFNDFLDQLKQLQNMGPLDQVLSMFPGAGTKALKDIKVDEKELKHIEAIILSMTNREREYPAILNGSRRKRIAEGSGTGIVQVNRLLKQFEQMRKMLKGFNSKKFKGLGKMMPF